MKNTNVLATAATLSDHDLLARLSVLAGRERETLVELLAHLAALDDRPAAYAAEGYGSLYTYCTKALRFSEDAACNRIEVARACRRFPVILDLLASGAMTLTSVRLLARHLTPENHHAVLEKAKGRKREELEILVATLAPRPDTRSLVRKLPAAAPVASVTGAQVATTVASEPVPATPLAPARLMASPRPVVEPTAPERYRVQFTIGQATHEKLRRLQTLLRREVPDGDPGAIFDRAVTLLLEHVEKRKLGLTAKPRSAPSIRPGTDSYIRTPIVSSRYIPRAVKRAVWRRDGGQCAFVSSAGHRCTERNFLEFHHIQPHAKQGPATVDNIALRCRRHNQYEAGVVFGPRATSIVREGPPLLP
jgi:hypothetical protein